MPAGKRKARVSLTGNAETEVTRKRSRGTRIVTRSRSGESPLRSGISLEKPTLLSKNLKLRYDKGLRARKGFNTDANNNAQFLNTDLQSSKKQISPTPFCTQDVNHFPDTIRVNVTRHEAREFDTDEDEEIDNSIPGDEDETEDGNGPINLDSEVAFNFKGRAGTLHNPNTANSILGMQSDLNVAESESEDEQEEQSDEQEDTDQAQKVQTWEKDPAFHNYIEKLVAKEVSNAHKDVDVGTPKGKVQISARKVSKNKVIKSPSDTTIYAPALNKVVSLPRGSPLNRGGENQVNQITNFIEGIRLQTPVQQHDDVRPGTSDDSNRRDSQPRDQESGRPNIDDPYEVARERAKQMVIEAEQFKATINAPQGTQKTPFNNMVRGGHQCVTDNEFFHDGKVREDDEFFHITCHVNNKATFAKIERGNTLNWRSFCRSKRGVATIASLSRKRKWCSERGGR